MASDKPVIKVKADQPGDSTDPVNPRWWTEPEEKIADSVVALIQGIENRQTYRRTRNLRHARLYANMELLGFQPGAYYRQPADLFVNHRVTLNVIKACVDTAHSKIAKAKPRPLFLTEDGDWVMRRKAELLTQYMDGAFDAMKLYETQQKSFRLAEIFGLGATKFYTEGNQVKCESVFTDELIVDDAEGIYGHPHQIHQAKWVNKDVLAAMFRGESKKQKAIYAATSGLSEANLGKGAKDLVRVFESWHLPSGEEEKDGVHSICIDGVTLFADEWKKSYFPFVFLRWNDRILGFDGQGIPEEIIGIQLEINKLLRDVQEAMHQMCVPRVFMDVSTKIATPNITNKFGSIVKFAGQPPIFNTAPAMPPEVYQHISFLYQKAFEQVGISMLSAASKKPAGLNSGVALREYQDVETERFELTARRYEESYLQAAEIIVDMSKDLAKSGEEPWVMVKAGRETKVINWADVDLKKDQYVMRIFPTSLLPTQPAAKLQTVTELTQAGFIQKDQAMDLLDFPDVEGFMSLANAAVHDIRRMIGIMLEEGRYQAPEPFMNLQMCVQMAQSAYLKARYEGYPQDRLDLLRTFLQDCKREIEQANAPQPQPGAAVDAGGAVPPPAGGPTDPMLQGDPMAVGAAPPVSDVLPVGA